MLGNWLWGRVRKWCNHSWGYLSVYSAKSHHPPPFTPENLQFQRDSAKRFDVVGLQWWKKEHWMRKDIEGRPKWLVSNVRPHSLHLRLRTSSSRIENVTGFLLTSGHTTKVSWWHCDVSISRRLFSKDPTLEMLYELTTVSNNYSGPRGLLGSASKWPKSKWIGVPALGHQPFASAAIKIGCSDWRHRMKFVS